MWHDNEHSCVYISSSSSSSCRAISTDLPDPSATLLYRPPLLVGLQGYILYRHRAVICRFVDGWPRRGSYLRHLWSVQKTFLCLLWREDHLKSCARENLRDWKRRMKRVSHLASEIPKRSFWSRGSVSWKWDLGVRSQDTEQWRRWPDESAFLVAV